MQRLTVGACALLVGAAALAPPSLRAPTPLVAASRGRALAMCAEAFAEEEEEALPPDVQCSDGRIVTELIAADKTPLPDRFMMAVRAIRGEFSPDDAAEDNERVEDSITSALLNFPAKVCLRPCVFFITRARMSEMVVMVRR